MQEERTGITAWLLATCSHRDILGSASYNAPAKSGARGSLWEDDYGLNAVGEYGVHYKGGYSDHNWIVEIVNGG